MAQKMTGALVFDERTDRYDIRFDLNSYTSPTLPCGSYPFVNLREANTLLRKQAL